jgi:hypothetical protein
MTISAEAKAARNAYMRDYRKQRTPEQLEKHKQAQARWRADNPEAIKKHQQNYWERKAQEVE